MWLRKANGDVVSLETGVAFYVQSKENSVKEKTFDVVTAGLRTGVVVITSGFLTEEDARKGLDTFLGELLEVKPVDAPEVPEIESVDDDEEEGK